MYVLKETKMFDAGDVSWKFDAHCIIYLYFLLHTLPIKKIYKRGR